MNAEEFLENYKEPCDENYGLFQRKSDGKILEHKELLEAYHEYRINLVTPQNESQDEIIEELKKRDKINPLRGEW